MKTTKQESSNSESLKTQGPKAYESESLAGKIIKLGIDVHADRYVIVRQMDGGNPQPGQSFSPTAAVDWIRKQIAQGAKVFSCYEAGPFGYGLHRQLTALGATNYVIRPRDWDEYGQQVKTDRRDAKQMVLALDRYVGGNHDAFCVVRVPTEAQEQRRSVSRQRESLQKEKQRLAAQGRSHALYYGCRLKGEWWPAKVWEDKRAALPPIVCELLEPLRRLIVAIEGELKPLTRQIAVAAPKDLPLGVGELTAELLDREIGDWNRFKNRRQVASYTGMCPREDTSDQRRFQGAINKHGNRRIRAPLIECMWRLLLFQPTYRGVRKWSAWLLDPKTTRAKRKQIIVAMGRQFSVDWWRIKTGKVQAQELGLKLKPVSAAVVTPATSSPTPTSLAPLGDVLSGVPKE